MSIRKENFPQTHSENDEVLPLQSAAIFDSDNEKGNRIETYVGANSRRLSSNITIRFIRFEIKQIKSHQEGQV